MNSFDMDCESLDLLPALPSPGLPLLNHNDVVHLHTDEAGIHSEHPLTDGDGVDADDAAAVESMSHAWRHSLVPPYQKQQSMPTTKKEVATSTYSHQQHQQQHAGTDATTHVVEAGLKLETPQQHQQQQQHLQQRYTAQRISSEPNLISMTPFPFPDSTFRDTVHGSGGVGADGVRVVHSNNDIFANVPGGGRLGESFIVDAVGAEMHAREFHHSGMQQQQQQQQPPRRNFTMEKTYEQFEQQRRALHHMRRPQRQLTRIQMQELYMRKHGMLTNYDNYGSKSTQVGYDGLTESGSYAGGSGGANRAPPRSSAFTGSIQSGVLAAVKAEAATHSDMQKSGTDINSGGLGMLEGNLPASSMVTQQSVGASMLAATPSADSNHVRLHLPSVHSSSPPPYMFFCVELLQHMLT